MKRAVLFPMSFLKRIAAVAAMTLYLTGCGSEIVDVTAPSSVTGGQPFEIEVAHQFIINDGDPIFLPGEDPFTRLVFVLVVPEAWTPLAGGSYSGEWDGAPVSFDVAVLDPVESDWFDFISEPGAPCEEPVDEFDVEECALLKSMDAVEYVPFFYGGQYGPPEDGIPYQLIYVGTELVPEGTTPTSDADYGVLRLPFNAGAVQSAPEVPFLVAHAIQINEVDTFRLRELRDRLPAEQQERLPPVPEAVDHPPVSFTFWYHTAAFLDLEIGGVEIPWQPSSVTGVVAQIAEILPVPVGGPALLALIALGLMGLGISAGRKKKRKI